jgi:hypothetical protein
MSNNILCYTYYNLLTCLTKSLDLNPVVIQYTGQKTICADT